MRHVFSNIEHAFDTISCQTQYSCTVILSRSTGKLYYQDEACGIVDELPDDFGSSDDYVEIPHQNDLDVGSSLVHQFMREFAPEQSDEVRRIFRRKGAYSRYKSFLDRSGLLDSWHRYEEQETIAALKQWCKDNSIELIDDSADKRDD